MKPKTESAAHHAKDQELVAPQEGQIEVLPSPSHDQIQQRAYEIWVQRGGIHGLDLENWLQAERDLKAKYPAG